MMNRLVINPAYAGELGFYSASISHRNQWTGIEGAPTTQNLSLHGPAKKGKLGLGLILFRDVIGVSKENNISFSFAYKIKNKKQASLSFGLSGSAVFMTNEWSQITTAKENDQSFSSNSPQYVFPDFSAGVFYDAKKYFVGLSIPKFIQHDLDGSSNKYSMKSDFSQFNYLLEAGLKIPLNKSIVIKPSFLARYTQTAPFQIDLNTIVDINNKFGIGVSYRTQDALVLLLQLHASDQIIIGYSFDYTTSKLQKHNNGSHEIFLRYDFRYKVKAFDPRLF